MVYLDVILNKAATIERTIARIKRYYLGDIKALETDLVQQDVVLLNLQRACQAISTMAMHLIREQNLGLPQSSDDAFRLLEQAGFIEAPLAERLIYVVGLKKVLIYNYQEINFTTVHEVIEKHLPDLLAFSKKAIDHIRKKNFSFLQSP